MYSRVCSNCPSQATTFLTAHAEEGGGTDGILEYVPKEKVTVNLMNLLNAHQFWGSIVRSRVLVDEFCYYLAGGGKKDGGIC